MTTKVYVRLFVDHLISLDLQPTFPNNYKLHLVQVCLSAHPEQHCFLAKNLNCQKSLLFANKSSIN